MTDKKFKKIMVYRTGHLGDTICAIPAFRLIRNFFEDAELTLLCDHPVGDKVASSDVMANLGIFKNILTYVSTNTIWTAWDLMRAIRHAKPDIVIMLPQVRESMETIERKKRFFHHCGVKDVRGHNFPALRNEWQPNEANRLVQILHSVGVRGAKPEYDLKTATACYITVKAKLHAVGVTTERPYLIFCGGGKAPTQRWNLENYAKVLKAVSARFDLPIIAVGSPAEYKNYKAKIAPLFPGLLFPEPFSLLELFELLRNALVYIGNDTGPMHLAAAVNCPVAGVFSARNSPGSWDPDVTPHIAFRHRTSCEDCFLNVCVEEQHRCMTGLTAETVISGLLPFMDSLLTEKGINTQGTHKESCAA